MDANNSAQDIALTQAETWKSASQEKQERAISNRSLIPESVSAILHNCLKPVLKKQLSSAHFSLRICQTH